MSGFIRSVVVGVAVALLVSLPLRADTLYFGEDLSGASTTNATDARSAFQGALGSFGVEDMNSFLFWQTAPLDLNFGTEGTGVLTGSDRAESGMWNDYVDAINDGFTITFDAPVLAFGFDGFDIGDRGAHLFVRMYDNLGGSELFDVAHSHSAGGPDETISEASIFWGVIAGAGKSFTSAVFSYEWPAAAGDNVYFDNFTISSPAAVPLPGAIVMGPVLLGFLAMRRGSRRGR